MYCILYTLEKTEGSIKNEQSRDIGYIRHTRHAMKTNKTQTLNTTPQTKNMNNIDPTKLYIINISKF